VKGALPEQILETVRRVAAGEALVPSKIASVFTESLARPELSPRELQVVRRLAAGDSNKEVGQMLQITEHTVKAHVKSILVKLGATGRTEAIAIAIKRGINPERLKRRRLLLATARTTGLLGPSSFSRLLPPLTYTRDYSSEEWFCFC
jgi:DNA-binding CsgD family transcriptional regulator